MKKQKVNRRESDTKSRSFIWHGWWTGTRFGKIEKLSGNVKAVLGMSKESYMKGVESNSLFRDFTKDEKKRPERERRKILESGQSGKLVYQWNVNAKIRWIEEQIFPGKRIKGKMEVCLVVQDVSSQTEIARMLEQSEIKYRRIFEKSLAGVYTTHVDGRFIECNQTFATILGFSSPDDLLKMTVQDIYFEPEDRAPYIKKLRKEGMLHHYTAILKRKDGRRIIVDNNVSIALDGDGKPNIIEGTLIDMTDIHEAKHLLELGEKKYRLLFEEANNAIILTASSRDRTIIDVNRVGQEMFRGRAEEIIGRDLREILSGLKQNEEVSEKLLSAQSYVPTEDNDILFRRLDGEEFYGEVWMSKLTLGGEEFAQYVIHDISRRKARERELTASRQSFKNIVDRSLSAIFIFDKDLLVYKNPVGENLFKSYLNHKTNRLNDVFPAQHKALITGLFNGTHISEDQFTEITLNNGSGIERSFSIYALDIVYNRRNSKLLVLTDISIQKEFHMQRHRAELAEYANQRLQREIAEHKKTQEELLDKTSILRAFHESSRNLFVLTLDHGFRIKSMNTNFKNSVNVLLGKEVKEGDVFLDLFSIEPGVREKFHEKFLNAFKGEPQEIISHFPSRTGEFWVESFFNPIITEGRDVNEISCISHDITEKIQIQNQIRNSETEMRAMLLAIPDFIFRVSKAGVFTYSRMIDDLGPLRQFFRTENFVGKHITDVFVDEKLATDFVENLNISLNTDGLHTQHFSFLIGDAKPGNKRFYENRFSKASDDEVVIISRDITEAMEYESRLIESVREKEILLREVHHRVKNNLQVINSILNLQSNYMTDEKTLEFINESQNRIRSMSYIHESLYQTKNFNSINFSDYISTLVQNLVYSYEQYESHTRLDLKVDKVVLALDQAIPCGLILNELISNALKYAHPDKSVVGVIGVKIWEEANKVNIMVEDNGIGLPEGFTIENSESLGLSLVDTLVKQLDGSMTLRCENGTKYLIIFGKQEI